MKERVSRKLLFLVCAAVFFLSSVPVFAEKLLLQTYSSADGLASSIIHHIFRDSKGFLWLARRGGLSRYDGYEFTAYQISDEEKAPLVHYVRESLDGRYLWIATDSALYRVRRTLYGIFH